MGYMTRIVLSVTLPMVGLVGLGALAEEKQILHINPFKRPLLENRTTGTGSGGNSEHTPAPPARPPVLEATLLGNRAPLARVNGKIVGPGDTIDGYTVTSIRSGEVLVSKNAKTFVLRLEPPNPSTKAENE